MNETCHDSRDCDCDRYGWMDVKHVVSMVTRRSDYHGYQTVVSCLFVRTVDVYMLNLYIYIYLCVYAPLAILILVANVCIFNVSKGGSRILRRLGPR